MIRLATADDAQAILDIYAPYIRNTSITFETEVPSYEDFAARINTYLQKWPWLVFEDHGKIAGYAYAYRHRDRTAYQWSLECSVYIDEKAMRNGIASRLYKTLFQFLKLQKFTTVYAVINLPNDRSVALHEKLGFEYFATYKNVGYKLGKWKNVGWWQLQLNDYVDEPPVPIFFSDLNEKDILRILNS